MCAGGGPFGGGSSGFVVVGILAVRALAVVVVDEDDLLTGDRFELGDQPAGVGFRVDAAGVVVVAEIGVGLHRG
jgi:hypothetical protein